MSATLSPVPRLIREVLGMIGRYFYDNPPRQRDFMRDQNHLTQAIARYGYECERRNWQFNATAIQSDLLALLLKIRETGADIKFFPIYLEGAVDRHIRQRADELSAQAKQISRLSTKALGTLKPGDLREPTTVEILATVYKDLKRQRRGARTSVRSNALKQKQLL